MPEKQTDTLIIGASIAGLSTAVSLQKQNINYIIIEKQNEVAMPWRNHYDRLHLHTSKRFSNLPFKKFGSAIPKYPTRQQVVDYIENYRAAFNINPVFDTGAISVKRKEDQWITETNNGSFKSKYLVMATGVYSTPKAIRFKGMETFPGRILHSREYKTGRDFKGQNVLVVGFGNSACEIAIDLYEQGAIPSMSVRSPVNVIPRDVFGMPVLELSLILSRLSPRLADTVSAPLIKWIIGDITKLGLRKKTFGPLEEIQKNGTVPLLDIGTIKHIREGHIKIYPGIDHIEGKTICFSNENKENFDAIVAGIGYESGFAKIIDVDSNRFDDLRVCAKHQKYFGKDGLYFCGYWISPTGQIREIGLDAKRIAADIARKGKLF